MLRQLTPQAKTCVDCGLSYVGHHRERVDRCVRCGRVRSRFIARIHQAVNHAIKKSILVRKPCEVCSNDQSEAHHDDYSKPLSVRWLCRIHHRRHHEQEWRAARSAQEQRI